MILLLSSASERHEVEAPNANKAIIYLTHHRFRNFEKAIQSISLRSTLPVPRLAEVDLHAHVLPFYHWLLAISNFHQSPFLQQVSLLSKVELQLRSVDLSLCVYVIVLVGVHLAHLKRRRELPPRVVVEGICLGRFIAARVVNAVLHALRIDIVIADVLLPPLVHPHPASIVLLHLVVEEALHRGLFVVELLVFFTYVRKFL